MQLPKSETYLPVSEMMSDAEELGKIQAYTEIYNLIRSPMIELQYALDEARKDRGILSSKYKIIQSLIDKKKIGIKNG